MPNTDKSNRPQVLLLGNGLNIGHEGKSWGDLMRTISINPAFSESLSSPMPLQAIIATKDQVDSALKKHGKDFYGAVKDDCQRTRLRKLLTTGFDYILTTNYSYELECAALDVETVTDSLLKKHLNCIKSDGIRRAEAKYMLHTYYGIEKGGVHNQIWHIHGEARKPSSMILGHYYYGSLFKQYVKLLDKRGNKYSVYQKNGKPFHVCSWLDAFILGDVYILGFGFDFSEFDLWWLLNRKKRENATVGTVYFYEKSNKEQENEHAEEKECAEKKKRAEKLELLKIMKVQIENLGMYENDSYESFYEKAIEDIKSKVKENKGRSAII